MPFHPALRHLALRKHQLRDNDTLPGGIDYESVRDVDNQGKAAISILLIRRNYRKGLLYRLWVIKYVIRFNFVPLGRSWITY